ncbi:MAG: thiolase family protein [Planctomycetaceae bacterium]
MNQPLAIIAGIRTPFCKAFGQFADVSAVDLGVAATKEVLNRIDVTPDDVDELVFGNVSMPADSANIARVIALKAGMPHDRVAHTVNRNCASGMESILSGWQILREGRAHTIIAGGTESMSNIPMLVRPETARLLIQAGRAKSFLQKLRAFAKLRPRHLKPDMGVMLGLTDPVSGLNMGETAEVLAKEFSITREAQDQFALESHRKASIARESCFFGGEITGVSVKGTDVNKDDGPREKQSIEALRKLRPIFDKRGSVTAGNSCPLTDGAAAVVLMSAERTSARDAKPLGYVTSYAIAGCDPRRMGLGPVYATAKLLKQTGMAMKDFDLIEINEAFAAQVLACLAAMDSRTFAQKELSLSQPVGAVDPEKLNIHGGAIALGHPVGTTGTRIVVTLLRALREKNLRRGLATLCVGGGQGVAMVLETELS